MLSFSFGKYTKVIAAAVAGTLLVVGRLLGVDSAVYNDIVIIAGIFGVGQGTNTEA